METIDQVNITTASSETTRFRDCSRQKHLVPGHLWREASHNPETRFNIETSLLDDLSGVRDSASSIPGVSETLFNV